MGVAASVVGGQTHPLQEIDHPFPPLFRGPDAVHGQSLPESVSHRHAGIQAAVGVLEDDLDVASETA